MRLRTQENERKDSRYRQSLERVRIATRSKSDRVEEPLFELQLAVSQSRNDSSRLHAEIATVTSLIRRPFVDAG